MAVSQALWLLAAAVAVLTLGGLLSAAEAALIRLTRAAAEDLVEEGHRAGERVLALARRRSQVLAAVSATRVSVDMLAAVLTTLAVTGLVRPWWVAGLVSVALNAVLLGVVVGASPRSAGRRNPTGVLAALAPLVDKVDAAGRPWRWLEARSARRAAPTQAEAAASVSEDLREMIDEIGEADSIEAEDRQMLRSVVELGQTLVREVMVPRTDMVTIEADRTVRQAMRLFVLSGFSRIPVIGEDPDDVRGVVYLKDLLRRLDIQPEFASREVVSCAREAVFVPETKPADDLLREMQTDHVHMALAVDEYGGIAGLVTMEDLLEEVVGEVADEHDHAVPEPEEVAPGVWQVPSRLGLDELGALFGLEIDDDDVDTVGGLLAKAVGRVPLPGAVGEIQGLRLVAGQATGRRRQVTSVQASRLSDPATPDLDGTEPVRKASR